MLNSMTAYGRASLATAFGRLVVEIQSVNRRFLEIALALPKELSHLEMDIRGWITEAIGRGQVTVRIQATFDTDAPFKASPNLPLAKQLRKAWDEIGSAISAEVKDSDLLQILANEEQLIRYELDLGSTGVYRSALQEGVNAALAAFIAMRRREGNALLTDMAARIQLLRSSLERIESRSGNATEKYRQRLQARIAELVPGGIEHEERILREICLFAERADIAEEITRFKSHLNQFDEVMQSDQPAVGKTLDFIVQEMNREANTVGSKAMDSDIAQDVIGLKSELERIREQLQNVE